MHDETFPAECVDSLFDAETTGAKITPQTPPEY